jgi:predicted GIY-YIG superfamily endonuclease
MTSDLDRRLSEHFTGRGGHYTSYCKPAKLLWQEKYSDAPSAAKRERQLKGWTRRKKTGFNR